MLNEIGVISSSQNNDDNDNISFISPVFNLLMLISFHFNLGMLIECALLLYYYILYMWHVIYHRKSMSWKIKFGFVSFFFLSSHSRIVFCALTICHNICIIIWQPFFHLSAVYSINKYQNIHNKSFISSSYDVLSIPWIFTETDFLSARKEREIEGIRRQKTMNGNIEIISNML